MLLVQKKYPQIKIFSQTSLASLIKSVGIYETCLPTGRSVAKKNIKEPLQIMFLRWLFYIRHIKKHHNH